MHILDLPIEEQQRIAKEWGEPDFDAWIAELEELRVKTRKELAEAEAYKPTKAEIARQINDLRTNPYAIEFYRRITMDDDLTVEEQIAHLESLETAD